MERQIDFQQRAQLMKYDLPDQEILQRYRKLYGVGNEVGFKHVMAHEALERSLTEKLLASIPENRWETFSNAYTELYARLPWLNRPIAPAPAIAPGVARWTHLIGETSRIFEIGSGGAALIKFLAKQGHRCVATEITKERGSKHLPEAEGWSGTRLTASTWRISSPVTITTLLFPRRYWSTCTLMIC